MQTCGTGDKGTPLVKGNKYTGRWYNSNPRSSEPTLTGKLADTDPRDLRGGFRVPDSHILPSQRFGEGNGVARWSVLGDGHLVSLLSRLCYMVQA